LTLPRIYPILDTASLARLAVDPIQTAETLLNCNAKILQFRHKTFWTRQTFGQATQIANLCQQAHAIFIINDRADYAMLLNAGLHLGQEDLLPTDARKLTGPQAILGFSTHNPDQLREAAGYPVDYLAFGPVYPTATKERPDPTVGIDLLRAIRPLTAKPLVAIGGITRDNAANCWDAGADSVAIIADLLPTPCNQRTLRERMIEWHQLSSR
jgi:thiamine-phosphate pyrophosphorylase